MPWGPPAWALGLALESHPAVSGSRGDDHSVARLGWWLLFQALGDPGLGDTSTARPAPEAMCCP